MNLLRPTRPALVLASTALATAALAGCGNGVTSSHGSTGTALSTPTASPTPSTPSGSASPQAGSGTARSRALAQAQAEAAAKAASAAAASAHATASGPPVCAVSNLRVGSKAPSGGASAGSDYLLLTFRNVSATACTMDGHPGVSFVGKGNGTQLGSPAVRTGGSRTVVLAPGATTTSLLQIANAGDYDPQTCLPTTSNGLRIYPPASRASVYVPFATQACQATSLSSPQLSVSAVGRAPAS